MFAQYFHTEGGAQHILDTVELRCGAKMLEADVLNVEILEGILEGTLGLHTLTGLLRLRCNGWGGGNAESDIPRKRRAKGNTSVT